MHVEPGWVDPDADDVESACRPHLDGDAGAPVPGQDVDLAAPHPYVGGEDTDAVGGEKPAGERLAETPQLGAVQIASSESSSLSM